MLAQALRAWLEAQEDVRTPGLNVIVTFSPLQHVFVYPNS